ncbi:hypothetical protein L7F22_038629 [Adiantum nelumboides]|nr:hypothetical protein [Adiantum nelumboides]
MKMEKRVTSFSPSSSLSSSLLFLIHGDEDYVETSFALWELEIFELFFSWELHPPEIRLETHSLLSPSKVILHVEHGLSSWMMAGLQGFVLALVVCLRCRDSMSVETTRDEGRSIEIDNFLQVTGKRPMAWLAGAGMWHWPKVHIMSSSRQVYSQMPSLLAGDHSDAGAPCTINKLNGDIQYAVDYDIFNKLGKQPATIFNGRDTNVLNTHDCTAENFVCNPASCNSGRLCFSTPTTANCLQEGSSKGVELDLQWRRPVIMPWHQLTQQGQEQQEIEQSETLQLLPTKPKDELEMSQKNKVEGDGLLTLSLYTALETPSLSSSQHQFVFEGDAWNSLTTTTNCNSSKKPNLDLKISIL